MRKEVIWNLQKGEALSAAELAEAERGRGRLFERARNFFKEFDLLVTPAAVVAPFDVNIKALDEVDGHKFENYYDWYTIAYAITATSLPALSLPCGFTAAGLPVALQLVGPPRGEARILSAAALMEKVFGVASRLPIDPVAGEPSADSVC